MRVIVACEFSGRVRQAFRDLGHDAWSCDLLPAEDGSEFHFQGDCLEVIGGGKWDLLIAFPPCTHLCSSGARWFPEKRNNGQQESGISFFLEIANADVPMIAVENPVGIMSSLYRQADQIIQPWWFGHPETKATCLWLKRLPKLSATNIVEPDYMRNKNGEYYRDSKGKRYSRIHFTSGRQEDRWKARSRTYEGVAAAMANQWGGESVRPCQQFLFE